jgi:pimeloyl-ACP methyl ester carboxylesterase
MTATDRAATDLTDAARDLIGRQAFLVLATRNADGTIHTPPSTRRCRRGVGVPTPAGITDRLAALLDRGRREEVVTTLLRELAGMLPEQVERAMSLPSWPGRVAAAHTVVRELRAHDAYRFDPRRFAALRLPTLLLAGSASPPAESASTALLAAALPGARVVTMAGLGHVAMLTDPDRFATDVLTFLRRP